MINNDDKEKKLIPTSVHKNLEDITCRKFSNFLLSR